MKSIRFSLFLIVQLSFFIETAAQSAIPANRNRISGRFLTIDSIPLAGGTVQVFNNDVATPSELLELDSSGAFTILLRKAGKYRFVVSSIGFERWESAVITFDKNGPVELEPVYMKRSEDNLAAVSVRGRKPSIRQTPYGSTVDVGNSVLTNGSSIAEVLERSPGVMIDRRNNSITLNGKSGVLVMLNGRLLRLPADQVLTLLNGMSANDIEKIELLTSPPVSYDADGAGGVINIISKKNLKQGLTGSLNISAGQGWGPKSMLSGNIYSVGKRFEFNGAYSWSLDRTRTDLYIESAQSMPVFGGDMQVIVNDTSRATQISHNLSGGFMFKPDSLTQAGINLAANLSDRDLSVKDRSDYLLLPDSLLHFRGNIQSKNSWKDWSASAFFERKIRKGKILLNADHQRYRNSNPSSINTSLTDLNGKQTDANDTLFSPGQRGFANTSINVFMVKADLQRSLRKDFDIDLGLKATITNSSSRSGIESLINDKWIRRDETINAIRMNESIIAGYFSLNRKFSQKSELRIGARFESARTVMKQALTDEVLISRSMDKLFPSVAYSKKIDGNYELQFSYSERITRPTYNDLASFVRYSDATAVYTGNPSLKPTLTKNIRIGYNIREFGFSLQLSRDYNAIAYYQLTTYAAGNLLYVSPQNLRYRNYYNIQINAPFHFTKWWDLTTNVVTGINSLAIDHTEEKVKKSYYATSANISNVFRLPARYTVELSGWFFSPSYNGTVKVSAMGAVNAGVKKEFSKNRGRLQLSVNDIFRTLKIGSQYGTLTREAFDIRNTVSFRAESRLVPVFKLTYSRSFGNGGKISGKVEADERVRRD